MALTVAMAGLRLGFGRRRRSLSRVSSMHDGGRRAAERPIRPFGPVGWSVCSFIIRRKSISSGDGKIQFGPRFQSLEMMGGGASEAAAIPLKMVQLFKSTLMVLLLDAGTDGLENGGMD